MSDKVKFYYELTNNEGATLFESLRDRHFDGLVNDQRTEYINGSVPGGDFRECFIDECLWNELNGSALDSIKDKVSDLKGKSNEEVRLWLIENRCQILNEDDLVDKWAINRANFDAEDGILWDFDHNDDVETALTFGLVSIPKDILKKINKLVDKANVCKEKETEEHYRKQASKLERDSVESNILVSGFYCDIHGGRAKYNKPIPRSEVITCPSCNHPICTVCANCYNDDPKTIKKAREFMASCDEVAGMAYCGQCGDWGEEFMLRFLKLVGCPIPPEYENTKARPRIASFYATATVNALPDAGEIVAQVRKEFDKGSSGIIKVNHPTGEIWGYPERHPEGWVVTVLYPKER